MTLSAELKALTLVALFTALLWLPYLLARIGARGLMGTMDNPPASPPPEPAWAGRAQRAHANAVENLVVFAPLVLVAAMTGATNATTAVAAQTYLLARVLHYVVYLLGIPVLRTLAFAVGWVCTLVIGASILGWVR